MTLRRTVRVEITLVIALAMGWVAVQQLAVPPAREADTASGIGAQAPPHDASGSREETRTADLDPTEQIPEPSETDALWESLRNTPGVEVVHMDERWRDPYARALGLAQSLELEFLALNHRIPGLGVPLEEAVARCAATQGVEPDDRPFCERVRLRLSSDRCEKLLRAPALLEEFLAAAEAARDEEQTLLAVRARKLAQWVSLARNLCSP